MKTVLLLISLLLPVAVFAQTDEAAQELIFQLVNQERATRGLGALQIDVRLTDVAVKHSALMARSKAISHQFRSEAAPFDRILASGLRFDVEGENVASNHDASSAHQALMNSPPHRANILNPKFSHVGIGVVRDGETIYVTEDFSHSLMEYSVADAEARIVNFVAELRHKTRTPPLRVAVHPELRRMACEMARKDLLSMSDARTLPGVSTTAAFMASDLSTLPEAISRLKDAPGTSLGVGVCYSASASHAIPVYWAVAVTFF
jgi:hypothetical protein